ncbi:hypothetical protein HRR90_003594 [Exophiala dermatitidis]|nr:hypothetical protein HRR74_005596 [Exophiala dermatitidis]KAJ4517624.1 hypothetical protein HRR73_004676 [Exophiala dermatitidis]KAJ4567163.1 hypothetical protein HRR81_007239 [Exophiala dermatitidis]KAJ4626304.1 hypothetical protein HRR86_004715 [Exophiala dermatitidis]KAJ4652407.1 hypothetical protein HRR91_004756 [Exophiala dermatitidis]
MSFIIVHYYLGLGASTTGRTWLLCGMKCVLLPLPAPSPRSGVHHPAPVLPSKSPSADPPLCLPSTTATTRSNLNDALQSSEYRPSGEITRLFSRRTIALDKIHIIPSIHIVEKPRPPLWNCAK